MCRMVIAIERLNSIMLSCDYHATHCRDEKGDWYTYSFGGYHAEDDERSVIQADSHGGPLFKSSPIDVHCCDVCEYVVHSVCY